MRKVKDIMTREVVSVTPDARVADIADVMVNSKITGLPVVEKGEVIGIITENDFVASEANIHMPTYIQILDGVLYLDNPDKMKEELGKMAAKTARELMSEDVVEISPEADIHELATLMRETGANPIVVLDDNKKLVGIVSRADILHLIAHES